MLQEVRMSSHTYPAVLKQADNETVYPGADPGQTAEWLEALDQVIHADGPQGASQLLQSLLNRAAQAGVTAPLQHNTPYINTIVPEQEVAFPGDRALEQRIENLIRYNPWEMAL